MGARCPFLSKLRRRSDAPDAGPYYRQRRARRSNVLRCAAQTAVSSKARTAREAERRNAHRPQNEAALRAAPRTSSPAKSDCRRFGIILCSAQCFDSDRATTPRKLLNPAYVAAGPKYLET